MLTARARVAALAAASAALSSTLLAVPATVAVAAPTKCDPGHSWYTTGGNHVQRLTHWRGYQLPPGGSMSLTKSATYQAQLTASVKVSAGGKVSANAVLGSAEANFNVELAASGSKTRTKNVSVTSTVAASNRDRYYVAWAGNRYYKGYWNRYHCNSRGTEATRVAYGRWTSFRSQAEGIALCPASRYKAGSWMHKACKKVWS